MWFRKKSSVNYLCLYLTNQHLKCFLMCDGNLISYQSFELDSSIINNFYINNFSVLTEYINVFINKYRSNDIVVLLAFEDSQVEELIDVEVIENSDGSIVMHQELVINGQNYFYSCLLEQSKFLQLQIFLNLCEFPVLAILPITLSHLSVYFEVEREVVLQEITVECFKKTIIEFLFKKYKTNDLNCINLISNSIYTVGKRVYEDH